MFRIGFLLGALLVLIVFGIIFPLLPSLKIIFTPGGTLTDWIMALLTLTAVSVAIWGQTVKKIFYKPNIKIVGHLENLQDEERGSLLGITRLLLVNEGNTEAKSIEIYVDKILDNGVARENFVPVPLVWTHSGKTIKSLLPQQYAYLDLVSIDHLGDDKFTLGRELFIKPRLMLVAGAGVSTYQDIECVLTTLELSIFTDGANIKRYKVVLRDNDEPTVKIEQINIV